MKKILCIVLVLITIHVLAQEEGDSIKKQDSVVVKVIKYPAGFQAKLNEVYSEINGWKGREDIYYNPTAATPTPVLFNIHGGAWKKGVKEAQGGFDMYFKQGFAVVNIEYRLSVQATAPAAVEDVRAAMLYVVKHAKELNINPKKIVVAGSSAGAHLALMAGLLQNDNRFDGAYKKVKKYTIVAIIDRSGITDVWDWAYGKNLTSPSAKLWLGDKKDDEAFARTVSPIYYVKKTSPPTYIVHGDADPVVPYQQAIALKAKFDEVGAVSQFKSVPGGKHGKYTKEQNDEISKEIIAFLKANRVIEDKKE